MSASHTPAPHAKPKASPARHKLTIAVIAALVVVVGGVFGVRHLTFALSHEETDDAQIEGDISPVLPRVAGYVSRILVNDNDRVRAGQPLLEIDPSELDLKVAAAQDASRSADAAVGTAEAALANARASEVVARANVVTAQIVRDKAVSDLARDTRLFRTNALSDSQLSDSRAAADEAEARLQALRRQAEAAETQVGAAAAQVASARAQAQERRTDLDFARLQRSYATVTAPISGVVSRKEVEPGQYVQAGQTVLLIASDAGVWIVANYKETQLADVKTGQAVEITVDAYKGATFLGHVQSIAGATGARFALLPPDNASGNFVKVTQRVPVKILVDAPDPDRPLRPGMSVDTAIRVKD